MRTKIIATIGEEALNANTHEIIDKLITMGIVYFRINLSRYNSMKDFVEHLDKVQELRAYYKNDINILIDLPYPNEKIRIFREKYDYKDVTYGDEIIVESANSPTSKNEVFRANVVDIDKLLENYNGAIIYGDGELTFSLKEINTEKKSVTLIADQEGRVFSRKAISFGKIIPSQIDVEEMINKVNCVHPDAIALSFVDDVKSIMKIREHLDPSITVFSKIENYDGVNKIKDISKISDVIVARGDLLINTSCADFSNVQDKIIEEAKGNNKKVAVATGILQSFAKRNIPTQAELIDLGNIKSKEIEYVIINYALVRSNNIRKAISIIEAV